MKTFSINDIRVNVAARIEGVDSSIVADILDAGKMHDNIIRALDVITAPAAKGGHGHKLIVTSAHSNHHDDGGLGPHGHNPHGAPGWAVDFVPSDDPSLRNRDKTIELIRELIAENPHVTKVGCPGAYATLPQLQSFADAHGTVLFTDEGTGPHIHIQSA